MVTDQEISQALQSLLHESSNLSNPNSIFSGFTTLNDIVQQLESKLGVNLSHKADFIGAQIHLLFRSHPPHPHQQLQHPQHPQHPPPHPKDHFAPHQNPNFQPSPSPSAFQTFSSQPPPPKPEVAATAATAPEPPKERFVFSFG